MQLLVSVSSAADARAAREGGADLIDAKDPLAGALGAVTLQTFEEISAAVAGAAPLSAALGDAMDETEVARLAAEFSRGGASFVKIGFGGAATASSIARLLAAATHGASAAGEEISFPQAAAARAMTGYGATEIQRAEGMRLPCGVIAAAYADASDAAALTLNDLVDLAKRAGASGVLLDTADKQGPGLRDLIAPAALAGWVRAAHAAGLLVALAGKLTSDDISFVRDAGADIAGVRGAACDGGRAGRVSADRVRRLRALCR